MLAWVLQTIHADFLWGGVGNARFAVGPVDVSRHLARVRVGYLRREAKGCLEVQGYAVRRVAEVEKADQRDGDAGKDALNLDLAFIGTAIKTKLFQRCL